MLLVRYAGTPTAGLIALFKRVAGEWVTILQVAAPTVTANSTHRVEARYSGTQVSAVYDGVVMFTQTVTEYQTATSQGLLWHTDDLQTQFDNFSVVPAPSISGLSSSTAPIGASITITGSTFGSAQGTSIVSFPGGSASISSWSPNSIVAIVPAGATAGLVTVTVGGVQSNGVSFTPTPPPSISSLTPASAVPGASVTIAGSNFGAAQGTSVVTFNGTPASVTSWGPSSITASVPHGASSGLVKVTVAGVASVGEQHLRQAAWLLGDARRRQPRGLTARGESLSHQGST